MTTRKAGLIGLILGCAFIAACSPHNKATVEMPAPMVEETGTVELLMAQHPDAPLVVEAEVLAVGKSLVKDQKDTRFEVIVLVTRLVKPLQTDPISFATVNSQLTVRFTKSLYGVYPGQTLAIAAKLGPAGPGQRVDLIDHLTVSTTLAQKSR